MNPLFRSAARFFRSSREHHRFPDEAPGRTAYLQPRWQWCHGHLAFWCLNQGELHAMIGVERREMSG